jgi:hypothetical protein
MLCTICPCGGELTTGSPLLPLQEDALNVLLGEVSLVLVAERHFLVLKFKRLTQRFALLLLANEL